MGKKRYPAKVFTRLRPVSSGEKDGHGEGDAVDKQLSGFDETSMSISGRNGDVEKFDFMDAVIGPEKTQEEVYGMVTPELLGGYLNGGNNALLFAYGQTGTGKTHTMFGPSASLASPTPHEDWGLLPRIVDASLKHMAEHADSAVYKLALSAVEFYCFAAWDLNAAQRNLVTMTPNGDVFGHTSTEISSVAEIATFIERVYGNRKVSSTKMNAGSSRSHVAIMVNLYQVERASGDFHQSAFSIVDLAGSERPGKTGAERVDGLTASLEAKKALESGKELSTAAQGSLINLELTLLTTAFLKATESWKAGKQFKPQTDWAPTLWFLTGCCTGKARVGVVVAISQSPQNGWETWFSCTWGSNIAKLQAPCDKQKAKKIGGLLKTAKKEVKAAQEALAKTAETSKYYLSRVGIVSYAKERLEYLESLAAAACASSDSPEEASDVLMELMALDIMQAFDTFDRNKDGKIDAAELEAILTRGKGPHAFSPSVAARMAQDVVRHFGTDGVLNKEGFVEFWRTELKWQQMSKEEKEQWFADNPEYAYAKQG